MLSIALMPAARDGGSRDIGVDRCGDASGQVGVAARGVAVSCERPRLWAGGCNVLESADLQMALRAFLGRGRARFAFRFGGGISTGASSRNRDLVTDVI